MKTAADLVLQALAFTQPPHPSTEIKSVLNRSVKLRPGVVGRPCYKTRGLIGGQYAA